MVRARARKATIGTYSKGSKNLLSMSTGAVGGRGQISWCIGRGHRQVSVSTQGWLATFIYLTGHRLAMRYPYVLAFEPTFVEIRHVETGIISQVIQGNNLRLLFTDTPPSGTSTANLHHHAYYAPQPYQSNPYQQVPPSAYGRPGYGPPTAAGYGQYPRYTEAGRDEILMVSDDRVLTLRLAAGNNG